MKHSGPLDRAFRILDIVVSAGRDLSLVEVVNASGIPQSSTFRLTSNLVELGMLKFDKNLKTYSAGHRVKRLAFFMMKRDDIKGIVRPVLDNLTSQFGETSYFVRREVGGVKLVSFVIPEEGARSFIHPGGEFPAHATATGKAIHSFEPSDDHVFDINASLDKYQDRTELDPAKLELIFEEVRQRGYAVSDNEIDKWTFAIAAPVFIHGEVIGAVGVVGPDDRMKSMFTVDESGQILKDAAAEITYFFKMFELKD